jgi:hypothetical protein
MYTSDRQRSAIAGAFMRGRREYGPRGGAYGGRSQGRDGGGGMDVMPLLPPLLSIEYSSSLLIVYDNLGGEGGGGVRERQREGLDRM